MLAVLKDIPAKPGIGTLSLVHPSQAARNGPDSGYVSLAPPQQAERTKT